MKVLVSEVIFPENTETHPNCFEFDIEENITKDDEKLSIEVFKLIKEKTGLNLIECTVDVD